MKPKPPLILYIAFGDKCVDQSLYSLVTLMSVYGFDGYAWGFSVMVLTDQPEAFSSFRPWPVEVVEIPPSQVESWVGASGFFLRVKIRALQEVLSQRLVDLFYVDCDTIFLGRIDALLARVRAGHTVMHCYEYPLRRARQLNPELCPCDTEVSLSYGTLVQVDGDLPMWNSGVLGVPAQAGLALAEVLELCDQLYARWPGWHVEQLSYGAVFTQMGLFGASGSIFHYWAFKPVMDPEVAGLRGLSPALVKVVVERARWRKYFLAGKIWLMIRRLELKKRFRGLPGVYSAFVFARGLVGRSAR